MYLRLTMIVFGAIMSVAMPASACTVHTGGSNCTRAGVPPEGQVLLRRGASGEFGCHPQQLVYGSDRCRNRRQHAQQRFHQMPQGYYYGGQRIQNPHQNRQFAARPEHRHAAPNQQRGCRPGFRWDPKEGTCSTGFVRVDGHPKYDQPNAGCRPGEKRQFTEDRGNGVTRTIFQTCGSRG
jgi:hypothetical protein